MDQIKCLFKILRAMMWLAEVALIGLPVLVAHGATNEQSAQSARIKDYFLATSYDVAYKNAEISPLALELLNSKYRSMANPGEEYQSTDQVDFSLPMIQMIYAGNSSDSAFVFYVIGGFGRQYELLVAQLQGEKVASYCYSTVGSVGRLGVDDLKQDVAERKLSSKGCFALEADK